MRLACTAVLGATIVASACSSDEGGGPSTTPGLISINAGQSQVGPAGAALPVPLSVIVRDAAANVMSGVTVTWAAATGGGSVNPATSTTNGSGIASTTRTLGTSAGPHTTTATVSGLAPVVFDAVAQVQGATTIGSRFQRQLIDTVLTTTPDFPVIALVTNQSGTPVPGIIVNWSASGGGSVSQLVDTTDAGGESQVNYTYGATAGAYGAQATAPGLVGSPVSFTLTAGPGNPAVLVKTGGDNLIVAPSGQVIYTVTTRDSYGNARNGVTIDWAAGAGGGSIAPLQNFTGGNGTATATRTLGAGLGDQTATATATGLTGSPATFTTTAANVTNVNVGGPSNAFVPGNVSLGLNGTVAWNWVVGNTLPHNVTFAVTAGAPANVLDRVTGSASRTFTTAGTFNYSCTNHVGMNGSVTVNP